VSSPPPSLRFVDWTVGESVARMASSAHGDIDEPKDGDTVGEVLVVSGWCLFEGTRVARVELFVDGRMIGPARTYLDRLDLAPAFAHPDAPVAGFRAYAPLDAAGDNPESLVSVRATTLDGRQWVSPTRRILRRPPVLSADDAVVGSTLQRRNADTCMRVSNRRTHIMVVTHDLSYGGGQLWLVDLLRQAVPASPHPWILVAHAEGPLRAELERLGVAVHVNSGAQVANPAAYEGHIHELSLLMQAHDVGVLLVNTMGVFPAVDAASRLGIPCLWAIHESFPTPVYRFLCWGYQGIHTYARHRHDASLGLATGMIFEAQQTADLFSQFIPDERAFIVDYGIELEEIDLFRRRVDRSELRRGAGFGPDDTVLLVVGTFEGRKSQGMILAAFDELAEVHSSIHLVLMGSHGSPFCQAIAEQARRSEFGDRIYLVPVGPDVYSWYHLADILVSGSDVESLPRSMLEAMAFELPIVATDVFGVPNIVEDGINGWLTRANDLEGLIGILNLVLGMSLEDLRAAGKRGRDGVVKRLAQERYGERIGGALSALLADPEADLGAVLPSSTTRLLQSEQASYHRRAVRA